MQYCKKAKHIDEFYLTMLKRKEDIVIQYFQLHSLVEEFNSLDRFYKKGFIDLIDNKWGEKINEINEYINKLPEIIKNSELGYYDDKLKKYFNIDNIKISQQQQTIMKNIQEVIKLQSDNAETLEYFNLPYDTKDMSDKLITLLQLAMTLQL